MTLLRYTIYGVRRPHDFGGEAAQVPRRVLTSQRQCGAENEKYSSRTRSKYRLYRLPATDLTAVYSALLYKHYALQHYLAQNVRWDSDLTFSSSNRGPTN